MNDLKSRLLTGAPLPAPRIDVDRLMTGRAPNPAPQSPHAGKHVMLCIPSGRSWEARTATAISGLMAFSAMHGVLVGICNLEGSMITKSRNDLVAKSLEQGSSHIMWIDSDMVIPPDMLVRFLNHEKDIVGATYNKRVPPYETLGKLKGAKPDTPEEARKGGLREAEMMPGGMMLIRTDVYRRTRWPWYFETYAWEGEDGTQMLKNYLRDAYEIEPPREVLDSLDQATTLSQWLNTYVATIGRDWQYFSEDLNFCRKVRKAGFRIWCDLTATFDTVHLGILEVTCKPPALPEDDPIMAATM